MRHKDVGGWVGGWLECGLFTAGSSPVTTVSMRAKMAASWCCRLWVTRSEEEEVAMPCGRPLVWKKSMISREPGSN